MERGSRKRSSSAGSEKMKRDGGRWEKMEGHCSTVQQWAVVPMEEEILAGGKMFLANVIEQHNHTLYVRNT